MGMLVVVAFSARLGRLFVALWPLVVVAAASWAQQAPPIGMLDFDRQVSFTKPLLTTVFRAFGDDHVYYILPNRITLDRTPAGVPDITLLYGSSGKGQSGLLSIRGRVDFGGDYEDAIKEIIAADGNAKFVVPYPSASKFTISTPSVTAGGGTTTTWSISSAGNFEVMARTEDLTTRILLLPDSYLFEIFQVLYSPVYRGVIHNADGTAVVIERARDVSTVSSGGCALSGTEYVNWNSKKIGCDYSFYPSRLVLRVQRQLKTLGLYSESLDGIYGVVTGRGIRMFQRNVGQVEDGRITDELLAALGIERINR